MALAVVQHNSAKSAAATNPTPTLSSSPAVGNLLFAAASLPSGTNPFTINTAGGWVTVDSVAASGVSIITAYRTVVTGDTGANLPKIATNSNFGLEVYWHIVEISGQAASSFIDSHTNGSGSVSGAALTSGSITPTAANCLVVQGCCGTPIMTSETTTNSLSLSELFTEQIFDNSASAPPPGATAIMSAVQQTTASAVTSTFTGSASWGANHLAYQVAIAPAASMANPSIVTGQTAFSHDSTSATLPSAPTSGNLLVAWVYNGAAITVGTGWTTQQSVTTPVFFRLLTKVAGASESATQSPVTNAGGVGLALIIAEIQNCNTAVFDGSTAKGALPATTLATTSLTPTASGDTAFGAYIGDQTSGAVSISTGPSGWTSAARSTYTGTNNFFGCYDLSYLANVPVSAFTASWTASRSNNLGIGVILVEAVAVVVNTTPLKFWALGLLR